ncbi:septum site-determining protein Ssd, partial [Rhodococcus chondri]
MNDVLALIADPNLVASLRRVAAASDRKLDEAASPPPRRTWCAAGLVVVDHRSARTCATALPRRTGVVLVCSGTPDLREWQAAATVGAEHVFGLPEDEVELLAVLGAAAEPETNGGTVISVVGGCGGAGASTFAAALAKAAAARHPAGVLLVDGDPFGSGLDVL